jgi:hypothetical protein
MPLSRLIIFAKLIKEIDNLDIAERPASIVLDSKKFGSGWIAWKKSYKFSLVGNDGKKRTIAVQNTNDNILHAVTKSQLNNWKNCKIVSERLAWNFDRIISCIVQVSCNYILINPVRDLRKLQDFIKIIFSRRR